MSHPLAALVYRSWAKRPLSEDELFRLAFEAQERNKREAITGVMVYDNGRFFQWLEGPSENVTRVMDSIRRDSRHTGIEILTQKTAVERAFESWSMKLATRNAGTGRDADDRLVPPAEIVDRLLHHPGDASDVMFTLRPATGIDRPLASPEAMQPMRLHRDVASQVRQTLLHEVIPDLVRRHPPRRARTGSDDGGSADGSRVWELADLLIAPDQAAARDLIAELQADEAWDWPVSSALFEPVARRLGDLWIEDRCSEVDVTLGLYRIQTAARLLGCFASRPAPRLHAASVLITPEPGELHCLGAELDREALWSAGMVPRYERPSNDRMLEELVSASWFDVLDVSFSVAFQREHWLSRLTETIVRARRASLNPSLLVVVGGRIFAERRRSGSQVGADLTSITASTLDRTIALGIAHQRAGQHHA